MCDDPFLDFRDSVQVILNVVSMNNNVAYTDVAIVDDKSMMIALLVGHIDLNIKHSIRMVNIMMHYKRFLMIEHLAVVQIQMLPLNDVVDYYNVIDCANVCGVLKHFDMMNCMAP